MLLEQIIIYALAIAFCGFIVLFYLRKLKKDSDIVEAKIEKAKEDIRIQIADALATVNTNSQQYLIAKERIIRAFSNPKFWQGLRLEDKKTLLQGCIKKIVVDGNVVKRIELLHLPSK